jgi:hypothetical protein
MELVPVTIDGHGPYVFLLDTGSSVSSVSRHLATALHLPSTGGHTSISGVVTSKTVPLLFIRAWKVGPVPLSPEQVLVVRDSLPGGNRVQGLLGSDELSRFGTVTLDFTHDQLRLSSPRTLTLVLSFRGGFWRSGWWRGCHAAVGNRESASRLARWRSMMRRAAPMTGGAGGWPAASRGRSRRSWTLV